MCKNCVHDNGSYLASLGNNNTKTRMVQLPATAAIEYVAACWVPGAGGIFVGERERERKRKLERKLKLSGGLMSVPPSSMPIRTV